MYIHVLCTIKINLSQSQTLVRRDRQSHFDWEVKFLRMPLNFCVVFFCAFLNFSNHALANEKPWIFTHWLTIIWSRAFALSSAQSALSMDQMNCISSFSWTAVVILSTSGDWLGQMCLRSPWSEIVQRSYCLQVWVLPDLRALPSPATHPLPHLHHLIGQTDTAGCPPWIFKVFS